MLTIALKIIDCLMLTIALKIRADHRAEDNCLMLTIALKIIALC